VLLINNNNVCFTFHNEMLL